MRARIQFAWFLIRVVPLAGLVIAAAGMMLKWWPAPRWFSGLSYIFMGVYWQSRVLHSGPRAFLALAVDRQEIPLTRYWGVRLVAIGAIVILAIFEVMGLTMIWPWTFEGSDVGLTLIEWLASLGAASMIVGMIATALRDFAAQTDRAVRDHRAARERYPIADE